MIMNKYDIFISKFKEIENLIPKLPNATSDSNFKWYEDNIIDIEKKNKLYLCRIIRNYIQHNKDYEKFIKISDDMIKFMENIFQEINNQLSNAETIMIKLNKIDKCSLKDKGLDVLNLMIKKKLEYIPLIENDFFVGIVSIYDLTEFVLDNKSKNLSSFSKFKKNNYKFVKPNILVEDVLKLKEDNIKFVFVTENGTSKTKILGLV